MGAQWETLVALRAVAIAWGMSGSRSRRLALAASLGWSAYEAGVALIPPAWAVVNPRVVGVCLAALPVVLGLILRGATRLAGRNLHRTSLSL